MHIYPHNFNRWVVWVEGNRSPARVVKDFDEAIAIAWDMALARGGNIFEYTEGMIGLGVDNSEYYARIFKNRNIQEQDAAK